MQFRRSVLTLLFLITAATGFLALAGINTSIELDPGRITSEEPHGYRYELSADRFRGMLLRLQADTGRTPDRSKLVLLEDGRAIGEPHSPHDAIRSAGEGRYSHWKTALYFSTSDNTDPRNNNRRYSASAEWALGNGYFYVSLAIFLLAASGRRAGFLIDGSKRVLKHDVSIALLSSVVALIVLFALLEIGFRLTTPFTSTKWPVRFDPEIGFLFEPHAEVQHTNHLNFWIKESTNSFGFLDNEPLRPPSSACHISFIGDSFVEAAQVTNAEKVQRIIEQLAAVSHPHWHLSASAFGYSGTGQLNQLPFYDHFARRFAPNVVVLVFVSNDYANNSGLLEALRNGWHPDRPPRVFAERIGGDWQLMTIAPDWSARQLRPIAASNTTSAAHTWLKSVSYFYEWLWLKVRLIAPSLQSLDGPTSTDIVESRVAQLRADGRFSAELAVWDDRFSANLDGPFQEQALAPAFEQAVEATRFAFGEFKRRTEADGAKLIVLAASQLTASASSSEQFAMRRLSAMLEELDIPLIDQYAYITAHGGDPMDAQFKNDGHWSVQGHRWAAEAILDWLKNNAAACNRR